MLKNCTFLSISIPQNNQTHNNRLADKTILLCGASGIQVDVIANTLSNQGANVIIAHTANDIFKSMKRLSANDGIFLTDRIKALP